MNIVNMKAAAIISAKLNGCNCRPDVEITPVKDQPGMFSAAVKHDSWCKLLHVIDSRSGLN